MAQVFFCGVTGKVVHTSRTAAIRHLRTLARKDGASARSYQQYHCTDCNGYHVSHASKSVARRGK